MSETQTIIATVKPVPRRSGETLEEQVKRMYSGVMISDYYDNDLMEYAEYGDGKYRIFNGILYDYEEHLNVREGTEIIEASLLPDGSTKIVAQWYNGGAGENEVLEEALNKL